MSSENDKKWNLLQQKVFDGKIVKTFELFRQNKIEPILIKGRAAAANYPNPSERFSVDIDLAVNPKDYLVCEKLLAQKNITGIDLHRGLRHLDTVEWGDLLANSRLVKINRSDIRILRPEDHLRILCVHWLNDGGAYKERLWDVYYAVENRPENFDWNRCLGVVSETRKKWIICAIGLARKYLGLSLRNTPIEKASENLPHWLIKTVEREWDSKVKLKPLEHCLGNRRELFEQIKLRIPPNALEATVEMEGKFDEGQRISYQIGSILLRLKPSTKKLAGRLKAIWKSR